MQSASTLEGLFDHLLFNLKHDVKHWLQIEREHLLEVTAALL